MPRSARASLQCVQDPPAQPVGVHEPPEVGAGLEPVEEPIEKAAPWDRRVGQKERALPKREERLRIDVIDLIVDVLVEVVLTDRSENDVGLVAHPLPFEQEGLLIGSVSGDSKVDPLETSVLPLQHAREDLVVLHAVAPDDRISQHQDPADPGGGLVQMLAPAEPSRIDRHLRVEDTGLPEATRRSRPVQPAQMLVVLPEEPPLRTGDKRMIPAGRKQPNEDLCCASGQTKAGADDGGVEDNPAGGESEGGSQSRGSTISRT